MRQRQWKLRVKRPTNPAYRQPSSYYFLKCFQYLANRINSNKLSISLKNNTIYHFFSTGECVSDVKRKFAASELDCTEKCPQACA